MPSAMTLELTAGAGTRPSGSTQRGADGCPRHRPAVAVMAVMVVITAVMAVMSVLESGVTRL